MNPPLQEIYQKKAGRTFMRHENSVFERKKWLSLIPAILIISCAYCQVTTTKTEDGVRVDKNRVVANGVAFQTNLFDLEYIGQLKGTKKKPFLIFSGRQCDSCEFNNAIFFHSPSDGPLKSREKQKRYNLPGPIFHYQTRDLLYAARLFWGEVIPGRFGLIWYQKELKGNQWVESVYFAELVNDRVFDGFVKSELKVTLAQMGNGKAWEIKGEPMNSEPE